MSAVVSEGPPGSLQVMVNFPERGLEEIRSSDGLVNMTSTSFPAVVLINLG